MDTSPPELEFAKSLLVNQSPENFVGDVILRFCVKPARGNETLEQFANVCRELWGELFPPYTLIEDAVLEALGRDYRLLLLSNTNAIHFPYILRHYPLMQHFDHFVLSYEIGFMKPDERIYAEAIARAGCAAGECFFTDDVQQNVDGARRSGMKSERFEGVDKLRSDLATLGVSL